MSVTMAFDGTFAKDKCCLKVAIFVKLLCEELNCGKKFLATNLVGNIENL